MNKLKQSETRTINRSQITLANYNPRKISDEAKKKLKANLKRIGLIGGIVWNEQTGNLVSGHQRLTIADELNKYNDGENDYEVKVEVVNLTDKEEKEQNIFFNSTTVQGEFDNDMLAELIQDIDYNLAGLDDRDINLIMADSPMFNISELNETVIDDFQSLEAPTKQVNEAEKEIERQRKIQAVKEAKQATKDKMVEESFEGQSYITVSFQSYQNKCFFMELIGLPSEDKFVKGEPITEMLQGLQ